MTGKVVLETDRLQLRELTSADVDLLVDLDADPEVMRFLAAEPRSRHEIETQTLPKLIAQYDDGPLGTWAAINRNNGDFLGWLELSPSPAGTDEAELGYRLRSTVWGAGLATEGALALVNRAFGELRLTRVWAETMFVNSPSRRVMEKVGLRHVRTFHAHFDDPLPGTEHGEVEYALTREEWLQRPRPAG